MSIYCPRCKSDSPLSEKSVVKIGSFFRQSDGVLLQRYFCKPCDKSFSEASSDPCRYQKKRHLNSAIFHHFVSGYSQRRLAFVLRINRKTVIRKFLFLGKLAEVQNTESLLNLPPSFEVEFDDLETFEHSKMKPLSVIAMVETKTRRVLGFKVARMPAKGLLAQRARKKYGYRKDERKKARIELFKELNDFIYPKALIKSDENPHYPSDVKKLFPLAQHQAFKGKRGCIVGQGELKGKGYDPLFALNHTYAMFRANINRLFIKTWNTTKKPERLTVHISMYIQYHNEFLIHHPAK